MSGTALRLRVQSARRRLGLTWAVVESQIGVTGRTLRELGLRPHRPATLAAVHDWLHLHPSPRTAARRVVDVGPIGVRGEHGWVAA